jgi:hypothetical protein
MRPLFTCILANMLLFSFLPSFHTLGKQVLYHLSYSTSPFCVGYFGDSVSLLLPGLALNLTPPDPASYKAKITGVSHWPPSCYLFSLLLAS